jgi:hypothetical protein
LQHAVQPKFGPASLGIRFDLFFSFAPCDREMFRLFSDAAPSHHIMLMNIDIKTFLPEAATAASASPCWHRFEENRQAGYVLALAGSCAR